MLSVFPEYMKGRYLTAILGEIRDGRLLGAPKNQGKLAMNLTKTSIFVNTPFGTMIQLIFKNHPAGNSTLPTG